MTVLRDTLVQDSDLTFTDQEPNVLGPNLTVKDSRITLRVKPKMLTLLGVKFVNCDINAKRSLNNFLWHSASLDQCRFFGTYVGTDFGNRSDGYSESGGLAECDFSDAILDGCRFFGCDMTSVVLPKWPSFTLSMPRNHFEQMADLDWPGRLGTWARSYSFFPAATEAITEYAPTLMKMYSITEQEVRVAISRLPNLLTEIGCEESNQQ